MSNYPEQAPQGAASYNAPAQAANQAAPPTSEDLYKPPTPGHSLPAQNTYEQPTGALPQQPNIYAPQPNLPPQSQNAYAPQPNVPSQPANSYVPPAQAPYFPPPPGASDNYSQPPPNATGQFPPPPPPPAGGQYPPPPPPPGAATNYSQQPPNAAANFPPPPPPPRNTFGQGEDDPSSPIHYTRDPKKLIAYLVPFPKPAINNPSTATAPGASGIPDRFLIYTPPPPPLREPKEGEKESHIHKVQRKWQNEVRAAKTSDAKVTSWKGVKGRATKAINWGVGKTTSSSLDFLTRVQPSSGSSTPERTSIDDPNEPTQTNKTVGLNEMVLMYPPSMPGTEQEIREEFVNTMLRSKSKAQRDAVIATGLLPVSLAIDILATVIWPFGGLVEIDAVWGVASLRGAKTARSVTKRLHSSSANDDAHDEQKLKLTFAPSPSLDVLDKYLSAQCHKKDPALFKQAVMAPTETELLQAIGWKPSGGFGSEEKNWEDEAWETSEVKEDLKQVMGKGAREWDKWCKEFQKDPDKALGIKKK